MAKVKKTTDSEELPEIDLEQLRLQVEQNKKERRKFLDYYAKRILAGTA